MSHLKRAQSNKKLKMFSRETKYLLIFYKICGFNPKSFEQSKISLLILTIHIIWACYSTYSVTGFLIKRFHKKETLHFVNSFVQFSSALVAYWMIIIESFDQQNLSRFWCVFRKIDSLYYQKNGLKMQKHLFQFIEYFVAMILFLIILSQDILPCNCIWFVYLFLTKLCQNRAFYYLFYVELINCELKNVQKEVMKMVSVWETRKQYEERIHLFYDFERHRFKWIREYFRCIHEMVDCVNSAFGWSHVATILFCFHFVLTESNWIYSKLDKKPAHYIQSEFILRKILIDSRLSISI